jgi:lipopolysaccharide export system protein LptC
MADLTSDPARGARGGMDYTPPPRTGAFRDAGRHTALVKYMKRAMAIGAVLLVTTIAIVTIFDPFRHLPKAISLSGVGVAGTKITMDHPKISGVQQGGGAYEIKAKSGTQDITVPSVIMLADVDASVGMADATTTHILSTSGVYDSKADTMALDGDVKIANTSGYTLNMKSAVMSFKDGVFSSHERLRVDLRGGTVAADDLAISNDGHIVAFRGHIDSTFDPPEEAPGDQPVASP